MSDEPVAWMYSWKDGGVSCVLTVQSGNPHPDLIETPLYTRAPAADPVGDDVEQVAITVGQAIYGPKFDPFQNPEAFEFCEKVARSAIAALRPAAPDGGLFVPDQIERVMSAKWLDPECGWMGCQSLVWKHKYEAFQAAARKAHDTLIELNPSNYSHDDVCEANNAAVEAILTLADVLGERHGKPEQWWIDRRAALTSKGEAGA